MAGFAYNHALILGKIVEIPRVFYSQFGEPTAHINVCTKVITEDRLPYAGNPWEDDSLAEDWVFVVCRDDLAERVERELNGGDLILCEGWLGKISWVDGVKKYHREVGVNAYRVDLVAAGVFEVEKAKAGVKPTFKYRP